MTTDAKKSLGTNDAPPPPADTTAEPVAPPAPPLPTPDSAVVRSPLQAPTKR
jgi:hypothetical protein